MLTNFSSCSKSDEDQNNNIEEEEYNEPTNSPVFHVYIEDYTGNYGVKGWEVIIMFQRYMSKVSDNITKTTNQEGYVAIKLPWDPKDIYVRFAAAIHGSPDGYDWNHPNFPNCCAFDSQEWTVDEGTSWKLLIEIKEPYSSYELVETK